MDAQHSQLTIDSVDDNAVDAEIEPKFEFRLNDDAYIMNEKKNFPNHPGISVSIGLDFYNILRTRRRIVLNKMLQFKCPLFRWLFRIILYNLYIKFRNGTFE